MRTPLSSGLAAASLGLLIAGLAVRSWQVILLALPPVGIWFDVALTSRLFGASGLIAVFVLIAIRSVLLGLLALALYLGLRAWIGRTGLGGEVPLTRDPPREERDARE